MSSQVTTATTTTTTGTTSPDITTTTCDDSGCWVMLPGGPFEMGAEGFEADETPVHTVTMPTFEILQTEVTSIQYQRCVDAGACQWPVDTPGGADCARRADNYPVVCMTWFEADNYCVWLGARLPSEAEWEYAARSRGQTRTYPWGDEEPACNHLVKSQDPCNDDGVQEVCARPDGHTDQGLCDMAGNAIEWVQDWHHASFQGAPADGSAWEDPGSWARVMRGGGINSGAEPRTTNRIFHEPEFFYSGSGFRCARIPS